MDIIIDTNIIIQENFLRSRRFSVLLDYLKKTHSKIVLPQIVKEEAVSVYEKEISSQSDKTKREIDKLKRLCFSPIEDNVTIEINKQVNDFKENIQKLRKDGLLYEVSYTNDFLPEIVRRMINREKPCSLNGEECRDVIVWLSIKKRLRSEKSLAFISNNTKEFASSDKTELHQDLRKELSQEKLELNYYTDVDEFIKKHAEKVDYITEEWIEKELSKNELNELIAERLQYSDNFIHQMERGFEDNLVDVDIHDVFTKLDNFYVYEMTNGAIYLGLVIHTDIHFEAQFEKTGIIIQDTDTLMELSAKVINKEIKDIEIDEFYF